MFVEGIIMFVELCKNNGTDYLRLVSSKRITDAKGRKVSRKKTELNIGPMARFDDGKPDYVQRLKESFKNVFFLPIFVNHHTYKND